ncbi:hypothetical protein FOZ63_026521 [Perkinsus olseni]|uniref:Uncharacterized protein n=1 Tax=Perkinsus olseni TaxID=32597 RepID=A0A7J6UNC9_PEROL|nr:hypothetical protein FOZ62_005779 [Perkinsus olseni]KAF4758697.1 hypothetical protein FOZ63_026521 [Perkinsus olseni]
MLARIVCVFTFLASLSEAFAPGKYCTVEAVPTDSEGTSFACLMFDYTSSTNVGLGYASGNGLDINLYYNDVTFNNLDVTLKDDDEGQVVTYVGAPEVFLKFGVEEEVPFGEPFKASLKLDGKEQNSGHYPFVEVLFDIGVAPNDSQTVYAYPKNGSPPFKLTKQQCGTPAGQDACSFWLFNPLKRALGPENIPIGYYTYLNVSQKKAVQVFANFYGEPDLARVEIAGFYTKTSFYNTGPTTGSPGPKNDAGLQEMTFSSPCLTRAAELFKARVLIAYDEARDIMGAKSTAGPLRTFALVQHGSLSWTHFLQLWLVTMAEPLRCIAIWSLTDGLRPSVSHRVAGY